MPDLQQHSCSHEAETAAARQITEATAREVAVMQKVLESLDRSITEKLADQQRQHDKMELRLFGDGSTPGIIGKIWERLNAHDRWIWTIAGALALINFLSGSGLLSLKTFLGK